MGPKLFGIISVLFLIILVTISGNSAQEPSPIILTNVELVTVSENSASITWVTNLPSDTGVKLGETESLG